VILSDEEKKKREEEAKSIINMNSIGESINSINYANINKQQIKTNNEDEELFVKRVNEANDIINSINPRQNIEISNGSEEDRIRSQQNAKMFLDLIDGNNNISDNQETAINNNSFERKNSTKTKQEIDKQIKQAQSQNVSSEIKQSSAIKDKDTKISLANPEETKNAQVVSWSDIQSNKEVKKKNENIKKGGVESFNEWADTTLNNIYGGAKQAVSGFVDTVTTLINLGVRGLEGNARILGLDNTAESLNNIYNKISDVGSDINETANYERKVTGKVENDFTRTSGNISNVISNMVTNQAIGYVTGINGTVAQGISVGGSSAQEVLDKNKDNIGQATVTGIAKGYTSYLTERMFDANFLTRGQKNSISKAIDKLISKKINSSLGKEAANRIVGVIGENVEELIEDNIDNIIDKTINNEETPNVFSKEWWLNTTETAKVTSLSTIIMGLLGLGGESFKDIEMDMETEHWINEAQKIIDKEDLAIHFNPNEVKTTDTMQDFYISRFTPEGELANIVPTKGKEIYNPNKELNVTPVVVRDNETNYYTVIDGNSGVVLDSTPYETTIEAQGEFLEKVNKLSDLQIKDINNKVNTANYTITDNIISMITGAQEQLNQMTPVDLETNNRDTVQNTENKNTDNLDNESTSYSTENVKSITDLFKSQKEYTKNEMANIWNNEVDAKDLNVVSDNNGNTQSYIAIEEDGNNLVVSQYDNNDNAVKSETIVPQNGKYNAEAIKNTIEKVTGVYEENNANKTPQKSNFYDSKVKYQVSNINEIEKGLGKNKTYTLEEISDKWDNIMEDTYDLTLQDDNYVYLDEDNGKLEAVLYDGETSKAIDSVEIKKNKDGKYSSTDINNAVKKVATIIDENKPIKGQVDIEGNEVRSMKKKKNQERGNSNVRNNNSQQKTNRTEKRENTRGEKEISRSNESNQEKLSRSIQQFQKEQQKQLGKDFKISLAEEGKLTNTEKTIQNEFEKITGLNYGVYETNRGTSEDAVFINNDILVKHNSLQNKKKSNFLPFHELGHWFKENKSTEWNAVHDIIDNTITKNQIEEYKNVLKDTSMFDDMSETETREYIIEEIESDYFGNWANDISNWADMIQNKTLSDEYVQLLMDISEENYSTHYNIFGTQEQQEQVYNAISKMMNNFITENKNTFKNDFENNIKYSNRRNNMVDINIKRGIIRGQDIKSSSEKNKVIKELRVWKSNYPDHIDTHTIDSYGNHTYLYEKNGNNFTIIARATKYSDFDSRTKIENILKEIGYNGKYNRNTKSLDSDISRYRNIITKNIRDNAVSTGGRTSTKNVKKNSGNVRQQRASKSRNNNARVSQSIQIENNKSKNNTIKKSERIDTNVVTTDNQGRQLTKEQQDYFKDSKVRDKDGNLLVLHHGTDADFNEFKHSFIGDDNKDGFGFYFTQNELQFEYDNPKTVYANIVNPATDSEVIDNIIKREEELYETVKDKEKILKIIQQEFNVDGIIDTNRNNIVVFNSNQIKNVDNLSPTDNPDIRYSNRYDTEENGEGGFYSQLEQVIEQKMPNTSNAQQIRGIIENSGIKQDELKWIGLDDYLKQHSLEKISKEQIQEYIKANQINIETVRKSMNNLEAYTAPIKEDIENKKTEIMDILDKYGIDYEDDDVSPYRRDGTRSGLVGDYMAENLEKLIDFADFEKQPDGSYINEYTDRNGVTKRIYEFTEQKFKDDMQELEGLYDELHQAEMELSMAEDEYGDNADEIGIPKYKNYSLEGGTNYQEILYRLPYLGMSKPNVNKQLADISKYQSPHWQENNVLAHARTQDFEDTEGNKVLFIDEIQSDLHQQGRKEGYRTIEQNNKIKELESQKLSLEKSSMEIDEKYYKVYSNIKEKMINKMNAIQNKIVNDDIIFKDIASKLNNEEQQDYYNYISDIVYSISLQYDNQNIDITNKKDLETRIRKYINEPSTMAFISRIGDNIIKRFDNRTQFIKYTVNLSQSGIINDIRDNFRNTSYKLREVDIEKYGTATDKEIIEAKRESRENYNNEMTRINDELNELKYGENAGKISDIFPFKKNWHEFVLRRMINNAVEQGYDEVAWTTGRQQRERYNLSKVIDSIEYYKPSHFETEGTLVSISAYKDGRNVLTKEIEKEHLADYLGKDLAMKIINSKEQEGTISNLDEEIRENSNNGMYLFYDQEIPNYLNKYLKKWNSKVEEITLKDADGKAESKQMGFKITDEMRNSIKQNGQPLFSNRQLEDTENSTYDEKIQQRNRELIKELRSQKDNIQGLDGYTKSEIKDIVNRYIQNKLEENDLLDITIDGSEIIGSRNRGNAKSNSDLDLVVEYSGDIREDDLFDILNEDPLEIEGIKVDINPITADKTGTLEEYLKRAKQYDKEVLSKSNNENISFAKRTAKISNNKVDNVQRNAERQDSYIEEEIQKVEKYGKWNDSIPITKLTDINKLIEDYLGLGIKKGHFRQSAYAIYKGNRDVIRTREYKDMDSILHETGHALDIGKRLNVEKESISNELLRAIDKLGGYENETRTIRLDEGFAEVIREYAIVPDRAKNEYPQTIAVIEKIRQNDKSFDKFISKVQQQTYNYIHQNPRNRTLSNVSIGEQTDRTPLSKNWIKQEFMRNVYDKDYALKSGVTAMQKINGKTVNQLKASENAYYLTRLTSGITDKVTSMLSDGYIDTKGKKLMPGLNQIGEILGNDPQRFDDLRAYLVAKRDVDYKAKTLKTGIRSMDSKAVIEQFKNDTQIQEAAKLVYDTLDGVMQYAVNNRLVTQEVADKLKESNAFYVPMQRVLENKGNQVGRRGAVADIIKQRTGSELDIKDVLENIIANSSNVIQQVENNNVLKALYKQGEAVGVTGKVYDVIDAPMVKVGTAKLSTWEGELKKQGVNTVDLDLEKTIDLFAPNNKVDAQNLITSFINDNGKRVYLQFNDELLFNSVMNMDKKFMSNVLKINAKLNMPLRYGATMANIGFAIPNMISDTAQAAIFSNAGFIPVVDNALGVLDVLAATNKTVRNFVNQVSPGYADKINNLYTIYQQTGATSSTRLSQYRESTQNLMKDVYGVNKSENMGIHEKFKPLKRLLDLMTYIPEISEQSTRFEVFKKNYEQYKKKGNAEIDARIMAALESRDATQDFGRTGNLTREINQLIPFSAARVGSAYTFAEKVTANPKEVGMRIAVLTALAMAIKGMGYDDDEIQELNQRKKDDNFVFKIGDSVVTLKKPQGILRSIVNLTEYIQDLATGHIDEGKEGEKLGEWLNNAIMDNMPADQITGLVPNMVAPLIENAINKDFYYNTDIVKSYDLELPDSEQYYDYNSQLAIMLGKIFNYSPAKIDNIISGYFAGLGTQLTNIMDYGLGKVGATAQKPEMGAETDAVGKRFIVNVNSNSSSVDEIYNRKTELTKLKNGGTISEEEEQELETITIALKNMSNLNKQIKAIKKDLTMSGKEKAEQIKLLQQEKTDTARQALGKNVIYSENEDRIQSTQFYPSQDTLKKNGYTLTLNSEMKKEYEQLASDYYSKYEKQGLYSKEKLEDIKSKSKTYAKNEMLKKYKSDLINTKK